MTALRRLTLAVLLLVSWFGAALGHALEPGYLDLRQLTADSWQVFWRIPDVNGAPMRIEVRLPDGCQPAAGSAPSFDGAAWVSAWVTDCTGGLGGGTVAVPGLERQRTDVLLRFQYSDAAPSTLRLTPDAPDAVIPLQPTTLTVFFSYARLGFDHILQGWDHLLFVFALLVLIRDPWRLFGAITAFTVAHSITLALATLGHLSVPGPPVEATIALSIVFLATEILKHRDGTLRMSERYPWAVSFSFGLLHGLGFAGALTEIGLPSGDIPLALLAFNLGVEAGQLTFVAVVLGAWALMSILAGRPSGPTAQPGGAARTAATQITDRPDLSHLALGYTIGGIATYWLVVRLMGF